MDNFFGTWKQETKSDNMKTLLDITDVTDKEKELMTNMLSKFAFSKNGDKYNIVHSCDDPPMSKSYLFTLGEPLETTDIFGRKIKSTLNLVNPNLLAESCSEWTDGVIDVSYEISGGDTMTVKFLYKGVTCTSILKKVSP